jgi:hypothetical protein
MLYRFMDSKLVLLASAVCVSTLLCKDICIKLGRNKGAVLQLFLRGTHIPNRIECNFSSDISLRVAAATFHSINGTPFSWAHMLPQQQHKSHSVNWIKNQPYHG